MTAGALGGGYGQGPNFALSRSTSFELIERSSSEMDAVLVRVVELERLLDQLEAEASRLEAEIERLTPRSCGSRKITWSNGYGCDIDRTN